MILVVGATGNLGRPLVQQLLETGQRVRAMTRDPRRASALAEAGVEVVQGDVRDRESLRVATRGVHAVVSASHAILGTGRGSSARVDDEGQRHLIAAAMEAAVAHFVYISVLGASPDHPVDFWRTKARIERHLSESGLPFTIIRPAAFMAIHAYELIGKAVVSGARVVVFGDGDRPRNFVAEQDVARLIVRVLDDPAARGETFEIGGPENLSAQQVIAIFERVSGKEARRLGIPIGVVRAISRLLPPLHEGVSRTLRVIAAGERIDERFDPAPVLARYPMTLTRLEDWARARVGKGG